MWTPATRRQDSRAGLRYETDLTDAEWRLVAPLLPAPKRTGRPLSWPLREIVNAIFYVMRGGIAWRLLPSDLPPKSTALSLVCGLAGRGRVRGAEPCVADDRPRTQRSRSLPERLRHRQPEREDQRSRRAARLRCRQEDHGPQAPRPRRHRRARPRPLRPPIPPACRIATGRASCWRRRAARSRSSRRISRTPATKARASRPPPASPSRSFVASPIRSASPSSRGGGSSSASSPGSIETDGCGRMPRPPSRPRRPSSTQPPPWSSSDTSREIHEFRNGL